MDDVQAAILEAIKTGRANPFIYEVVRCGNGYPYDCNYEGETPDMICPECGYSLKRIKVRDYQ